FQRGHCPGADEQKDGAARHLIILFGHRVRIVWCPKCRAASYEPMYVDVGQPGELRIARVHAPDMASKWDLPAMRVFCVVEVVVPLRVCTNSWIVLVRSQR